MRNKFYDPTAINEICCNICGVSFNAAKSNIEGICHYNKMINVIDTHMQPFLLMKKTFLSNLLQEFMISFRKLLL